MDIETVWLCIGFLGQAMFSARFLVQWITSESKKQSVIPIQFWYLSLAGGIILLAYAIYRVEPVFITGQAAGVFVYTRNLVLISRENAD